MFQTINLGWQRLVLGQSCGSFAQFPDRLCHQSARLLCLIQLRPEGSQFLIIPRLLGIECRQRSGQLFKPGFCFARLGRRQGQIVVRLFEFCLNRIQLVRNRFIRLFFFRP